MPSRTRRPAKNLSLEDIGSQLRDVIKHMNHKFGALQTNMNQGFSEAAKDRQKIRGEMHVEFQRVRKELKVEQSLMNDTFKRMRKLEERTSTIEKHLLLA